MLTTKDLENNKKIPTAPLNDWCLLEALTELSL